jgi:hypothetical protein
VKRLQKAKFNFVEQGVCTRAFRITAFVAGSGKIFANLTALVSAFSANKSLIPLQFTQIFFTIFICFEALSKLYDVLSFKNVHFMQLMIDKYMKLNSHLLSFFYEDKYNIINV